MKGTDHSTDGLVGRDWIHQAAADGDSARLSSLLNDGADPIIKDWMGRTALMWASMWSP